MPDHQQPRDDPGVPADPAPFACTWTNDDLDAPWVHVTGRLDAETTPQLQRTMSEAQLHVSVVVLDLRQVSSVDEFALRAIAAACSRTQAAGGTVLLVRGPGVQRSLARSRRGTDIEHMALADVHPRVCALLGRG